MNLNSILSILYDRLAYTSSPDAATVSRLKGYINETHREVLAKRGLTKLRRWVIPFTTVAGNQNVTLPEACVRLHGVTDRTNNRELDETDVDTVRRRDPGLLQSTSTPDAFAVYNLASALQTDLTAAAAVYGGSDVAGDDNTKKLFIEGIAGGRPIVASIAMNGLTQVLPSALATFTQVTKFYIGLAAGGVTTAAGNITLTQGLAGAEISRIIAGRAYARYSRILLAPTPSTIMTLYADCDIHIEEMSNLGDEPLIPEDFHRVLVDGSLMKEYEKRKDPQSYGQAKARFNDGIAELRLWVTRPGNVAYRPLQFSQLGAYFEAGT